MLITFGLILLFYQIMISKASDVKAAAMINNRMAGELTQNLEQDTNLIVSGFSLGSAMGMLLLGAKVSTKSIN